MKKVLIIDSDVALLNSLSHYIMQSGYEVDLATNAQDGLAIAESASLIIVAVELPDQNGFVVCSTLKRNPKTANIPVFITSSADTTAAFEQHLNLANHADGYFLKPLDTVTLIQEMVSIFADIDANYEEMVDMGDDASAPAPEADGDDGEVIKALSLDDMNLFEDIDSNSLEVSSDIPLDEHAIDMEPEPDPDIPAPDAPVSVLPSSLAAPVASVSSMPAAKPARIPSLPSIAAVPKPAPISKTTLNKLPSKPTANSQISPKTSPAPSSTVPKTPAKPFKPVSSSLPKTSPIQSGIQPGLTGNRSASTSDIKPAVARVSTSASFSAISQSAISAADSSRLNDEITVLKNEIAVLKSEITTRDNRITMLQSQCDALTSRCQNAEAIADALKNESAQIGAQFDEMAQTDAARAEELQALIAMDAEKTEQINALTEAANQKNKQIEQLIDQTKSLLQQILDLTQA